MVGLIKITSDNLDSCDRGGKMSFLAVEIDCEVESAAQLSATEIRTLIGP